MDRYVENEPFLVRISAAKRLRDRAGRDARYAGEDRVSLPRVRSAMGAATAGSAA
jgi:chlorophyllide a reductase subunit Z